jgi:hypothetical protein
MMPQRPRQRGYALFDALLAFVIAMGGIYALVAMQTRMARDADVAKQRTEATRLAQERIELLRSYTTIQAVGGQLAWVDLAAGNDSVSTNATFARSWQLGGDDDDTMRTVTMNIDWTDRAGDPQSVTMSTVISRTDPAHVGALGFPLPENTTLKRPKNRNLNIPVPAKDLGNGKSVYQLSSNFAVVFSNDSGYVVQRCDHEVNTVADLDTGCTSYDAYILAGYVSRTMSSFPSPLGVNTAGLTGLDGTRSVQCSMGAATDQNTGAAIDGYQYYLCILPVEPGGRWSGTVRLSGMALGSSYLVCRFQQPEASGVSPNLRNVQPYASVGESLDGQNYVITSGGSCPSVSGLATTLHQSCTSTNVLRLSECPAS